VPSETDRRSIRVYKLSKKLSGDKISELELAEKGPAPQHWRGGLMKTFYFMSLHDESKFRLINLRLLN